MAPGGRLSTRPAPKALVEITMVAGLLQTLGPNLPKRLNSGRCLTFAHKDPYMI